MNKFINLHVNNPIHITRLLDVSEIHAQKITNYILEETI